MQTCNIYANDFDVLQFSRKTFKLIQLRYSFLEVKF